MDGFAVLVILISLLAVLYMSGKLPTAGIVSLYKRIRLVGLMWALMMTVLGVTRAFNIL